MLDFNCSELPDINYECFQLWSLTGVTARSVRAGLFILQLLSKKTKQLFHYFHRVSPLAVNDQPEAGTLRIAVTWLNDRSWSHLISELISHFSELGAGWQSDLSVSDESTYQLEAQSSHSDSQSEKG